MSLVAAAMGGHADGVRFAGDRVWKRVQDRGRGERERVFLEAAARDPRWRPFVPAFEGVQTDDEGVEWLVMRSLHAGIDDPVCMDVKMGTRTWGAMASPTKQRRQQRKSAVTTSGALGLRISAAIVRRESAADVEPRARPASERVPEGPGTSAAPGPALDGGVVYEYLEIGQKKGRPARTRAEVRRDLGRYLRTPRLRADARAWLESLERLFLAQTEWCFYGSSLLLAYDDRPRDERAARLRCCMIDFAHTHRTIDVHGKEDVDSSYLHGLGTFIELLQELDEGRGTDGPARAAEGEAHGAEGAADAPAVGGEGVGGEGVGGEGVGGEAVGPRLW
jgi:hypothetical protein